MVSGRPSSIIDETKVGKKKSGGFLDFFIPKMCDDYMHAEKSFLSINFP